MKTHAVDKTALMGRVRAALRDELDAAERVARETADAANHPEARPENDKDTRKIELSYLAAGQAARARDLDAALSLLPSVKIRVFDAVQPIESGALVSLEVEGKAQRVFLLPAGGGMKVETPSGEISVVTPQAPLGRALLGKIAGESFEVAFGGKSNEVEILHVE